MIRTESGVADVTLTRTSIPRWSDGNPMKVPWSGMAWCGSAGGAFGLAALPFELPVSTIIMLRSIADIARSEGEDLSDPDTALSCVQVFALGGRAGFSTGT